MNFDLKFVLLVVLHVLHWSSSLAKSLRELSADEYNNLATSVPSRFVAVYFDHKVARKNYPTLLKELRKSADVLDAYGVQITRINCDVVSLEPCSEESIHTFRDGVFEAGLELDYMFNENSIVSNLLQTLLTKELPFITTFHNGMRMMQEARRDKKDLVFAFVKGLGNADHATITKIAFVYAENMTFGLTTNETLAEQFDGLSGKTGSLAVYLCKDAVNENQACKVATTKRITVISIAQFIQMLRQPKFVYLPENGTTVYDTLPLSIDKLYIFTDKTETFGENELNTVTDGLAGVVGIVIVDVNKHKDKLTQFGLTERDSIPTAAFITASSSKSEPNVELFADVTFVFSLDNLVFLLNKLIKNPKKEYRILAESSSLQTITYEQFSKISSPAKTFLYSKSYLLLAFCEEGSSSAACQDFAKHYRRLVRTFDRMEDDDVLYVVHVTLDDGQEVHIGKPKLPHLRLYTKKNPDDYIVFKGKPDYDGLLKFIKQKTSMDSVVRLPPSNVDAVPIVPESNKIEEDEDKEEVGDDEEEQQDRIVPPEETEDDEVAGAVWYSDLPKVPEDKVPSLTDKTFTPTRDENDLLVVNFFQPWDSRSRALVGPYVEAALSLGEKDVGKFNIRLARVNCFDWTDVCQNNNITTYPTIKLFRKGSDELVYEGPLDADNLVKTVLLLHLSSPLQLDSQDKIESFLTGEYPKNAQEASETAVVGLFAGADSKELQAFSDAAKELRGQFLLGYATGELAKEASVNYGIKSPAAFLVNRNDVNRPRAVFDQDFSATSIIDFIRMSSISSFGEITPMNLPLYFKHNRPLLIAFRATAVEDSTLCPIMKQFAQDPGTDPVMLTWMSLTSNDVNDIILETYTGKTETPALVLLHHHRGVLYHYKDNLLLEEITAWVKRCLSGEQNPTRFLKNGNWKPLLEGYDYLAMLEEEEKNKKNKDKDDDEEEEEGTGEITGGTPPKMSRLRQQRPEDLRDEEEIKKHDEL